MFGLQLVAVLALSQGGAVYEPHRGLSEVDWAGEFYAYGTAVAARKDLTRVFSPTSSARRETGRYLLLTSLADDFSNTATLLYALMAQPGRSDERYVTAFLKGTESPSFAKLYGGEYFKRLEHEDIRKLVQWYMSERFTPNRRDMLMGFGLEITKTHGFMSDVNGLLRVIVDCASRDKRARGPAMRMVASLRDYRASEIPYLRYFEMILAGY